MKTHFHSLFAVILEMCKTYKMFDNKTGGFERDELIFTHISTYFGAISTAINIILLIIFIYLQGYRKFPVRNSSK